MMLLSAGLVQAVQDPRSDYLDLDCLCLHRLGCQVLCPLVPDHLHLGCRVLGSLQRLSFDRWHLHHLRLGCQVLDHLYLGRWALHYLRRLGLDPLRPGWLVPCRLRHLAFDR